MIVSAKVPTVDATQEMVALGISNIAGSFFLSMPVNASFGRSAVNSASGVKSTLGGLVNISSLYESFFLSICVVIFQVTGTLILLALVILMPFCAFLPKTSLAAVIICAVIYNTEYEIILPLWRSKSEV